MPLFRRLFASVPAVWTAWVLARIGLGFIILENFAPRGDVAYYFYGEFGDDPSMMTEYPHAGTWPVEILTSLIGNRLDAFFIAFVLMCMLFDALFLALVLREHQNNSRVFIAGWFWALFGTLAGQVFYMRLDIFPALAVAAAAACITRWPHLASAMLAFATTMKLWPGVLAAGLVGKFNQGKSWLRLVSFFGGLAVLCAITVVTSGWERLISPLTYQDVRGLQIESIPATPFVYQAFFEPERWEMGYASSKSFEIAGPGVQQAIDISTWAMAGVIIFALLWALWRFIAGGWQPRSTIAFFGVMILLLLVTNKVFSPQYIVWFGPLLAVAIRQPKIEGTPKTRIAIRTILMLLTLMTLAAAGLGTYVYPTKYNFIWDDVGIEYAPVLALTIRNGLIVAMAVLSLIWLALETWRDAQLTKAGVEGPNLPLAEPHTSSAGEVSTNGDAHNSVWPQDLTPAPGRSDYGSPVQEYEPQSPQDANYRPEPDDRNPGIDMGKDAY